MRKPTAIYMANRTQVAGGRLAMSASENPMPTRGTKDTSGVTFSAVAPLTTDKQLLVDIVYDGVPRGSYAHVGTVSLPNSSEMATSME